MDTITITLNGHTKVYTKESATKVFTKAYTECEESNRLYTTQAMKICYVLAFLKRGETNINADTLYC